MTFWARGEKGGETATIGIGIIDEEKTFFDTARIELPVTLKAEWQKFEIPLEGKDLSRIKSGFYIVTKAEGLPFTVFVDAKPPTVIFAGFTCAVSPTVIGGP